MILTVSVVTGFQNKIRDKVISFGSHIQIASLSQDYLYENEPVIKNQDFIQEVKNLPGVAHVQPFGFRPGILQSGEDTIHYSADVSGAFKDTFLIRQEIKSVLVKGIDENFNGAFFNEHIKEGSPLQIKEDTVTDGILISRKIAQQIHLEVGDDVRAYFVDQSGPKIRKFTVQGVYHTGMEEFDEELIFADLRHVQKLNNWGVEGILNFSDTCFENQFLLEVNVSGGNKNYYYDWGNGFSPYSKKAICPDRDTSFKVIVSDFDRSPTGVNEIYLDDNIAPLSVPDTAFLSLKVNGKPNNCLCDSSPDSITYDEDGWGKDLYFNWGSIRVDLSNSGGSSHLYCGGFEIIVSDWERLQEIRDDIFKEVPPDMKVETIAEIHPEIFNWLDFLDTNVIIIITLMIVIAIINMSSALLVLILEKTNMIGMLKALGTNSWSVRKIFLYLSAFLIFRGLFWGNLLGIGLAFIQLYFEPLKLNPEVYYLEAAPIELNWTFILLINAGTLVVCLFMLVVPSIIINKISAIKAIRFD